MPVPFALGTFAAEEPAVAAQERAVAADGGSFAGLVVGDRVLALDRSVRELLEDWNASLPHLQSLADAGGGDHELGALRPLPPVLPCGQIFQAGANYRQHVLDLMTGAEQRADSSDGLTAERRDDARRALDERARDGEPFVFQGSVHSMVGAEDDVTLPADHAQHDWELELAAVIGRRARRVPRERALECVAGYTICNDITTRDALIRPDAPGGLDWLAAKNSPTFLPTGPLLVPAVHAGDPMDLRITLSVNGKVMQDGTTADMLFDVARLIEYVSTIAELRPGDLLLTGSPAGNGAFYGVFLSPGDVMEGSITGLGTQRNRCVAERVGVADLAIH